MASIRKRGSSYLIVVSMGYVQPYHSPFFICFCNKIGSHSQRRPSGHRHSAGNPSS